MKREIEKWMDSQLTQQDFAKAITLDPGHFRKVVRTVKVLMKYLECHLEVCDVLGIAIDGDNDCLPKGQNTAVRNYPLRQPKCGEIWSPRDPRRNNREVVIELLSDTDIWYRGV